jgi:uncharacterized membrane protein YfhO
MSFLYKFNLDFAGMAASILCALHCIALPLFLSLGLTTSSSLLHNHSFDIAIIGIGIVIACLSLLSDYKKHKSILPLSCILVGFVVLIYGLKSGHGYEHAAISVLGSLIVTTAHIVNWKKAKAAKI